MRIKEIGLEADFGSRYIEEHFEYGVEHYTDWEVTGRTKSYWSTFVIGERSSGTFYQVIYEFTQNPEKRREDRPEKITAILQHCPTPKDSKIPEQFMAQLFFDEGVFNEKALIKTMQGKTVLEEDLK